MSHHIEASAVIDGVIYEREFNTKTEVICLADFLYHFDHRVYNLNNYDEYQGLYDFPYDIVSVANFVIPLVRPKSPDDRFHGGDDISDKTWYKVRDMILFANDIRSGLYGSY